MKRIKKRDGKIVEFDINKIYLAIKKVFFANNISDETLFKYLTEKVVNKINSRFDDLPTVEKVQDIVELILLEEGYTEIARAYMSYRVEHKVLRQEKTKDMIRASKLNILVDNRKEIFDVDRIKDVLENLSIGLDYVYIQEIVDEVCKTVYDNIKVEEVDNLILNSIKQKIEEHYNYSYFSSRFVLNQLYKNNLGLPFYSKNLGNMYQYKFSNYLDKGIELGLISPKLREFNLQKISAAIISSRDLLFMYLGMQTLEDRYLLKTRNKPQKVFELPQWMWMRVAMGMALKEENKEEKAIEFYNVMSQFYALSSTPTLFNSGTTHSQMSSCYLNTVEDSLDGIFKAISDTGKLSKWAGGVGTDWTPVRAKGSKIRGTNGESQGIIPFIKIYNDVALAVNQGGKRKGALAAYLEIWHSDIEEFLELRKNTGDERRRAHDIHPAVFVCDLFIKRVRENGKWTLFSPDKVPDLHDLYGKKFEERYQWYEKQNIEGTKIIEAMTLWRKVLTMLYETGHPWITFKDPINIRNPQDHVGVIHNSNLCTEITLNSSKEETAVCNLASINLAKMIKNGKIDDVLLKNTVTTVIRMLDNVIDNNFYPTKETEIANLKHRPIGMGVMGYQDALYQLGIDFDSADNIEFADLSMEMLSYYAILASSKLAKERGCYSSYEGSKWSKGILPLDTLEILRRERGLELKVDKKSRMEWSIVKNHIKEYGMRNSNTMAIAPTATIANISGVVPCVEPIYKNIYMKENMSGSFIVINNHLIDALASRGLWNKNVLQEIKIHDGSIKNVKIIPNDIKRRFKETYEIEPMWILECAARRGKWIDQAASTNIFLQTTKGKVVSDIYMLAWELGLKTTYYLRTMAATQVTKTIQTNKEIVKPGKIVNRISSDPNSGICESCQ